MLGKLNTSFSIACGLFDWPAMAIEYLPNAWTIVLKITDWIIDKSFLLDSKKKKQTFLLVLLMEPIFQQFPCATHC